MSWLVHPFLLKNEIFSVLSFRTAYILEVLKYDEAAHCNVIIVVSLFDKLFYFYIRWLVSIVVVIIFNHFSTCSLFPQIGFSVGIASVTEMYCKSVIELYLYLYFFRVSHTIFKRQLRQPNACLFYSISAVYCQRTGKLVCAVFSLKNWGLFLEIVYQVLESPLWLHISYKVFPLPYRRMCCTLSFILVEKCRFNLRANWSHVHLRLFIIILYSLPCLAWKWMNEYEN